VNKIKNEKEKTQMKKTMTICTVVMMMLAISGVAQANWSDNFNGGAQQTWTVFNGGTNSSATFTNNRYQLHTEGTSTTPGSLVSYVSESFTDCVVQGRIQQINSGDNFLSYLLARANTATMSAYVLGVGSLGGGGVGHLWIGKLTNGAYSNIAVLPTQPTFDYTDCQAKFSLVGDTLQAKVWTYGTSEPSWQISVTDTSYASGSAGVMLATYPTLGWNSVQVAFDDVSAVPEPATMCLLGLGVLGLLRRKCSKA
jgi:hypothetical protein